MVDLQKQDREVKEKEHQFNLLHNFEWCLFREHYHMHFKERREINPTEKQYIYMEKLEDQKTGLGTPFQSIMRNRDTLYHVDFASGNVAAHPLDESENFSIVNRRKVPQQELDTRVFPVLREFVKDPFDLFRLSEEEIQKRTAKSMLVGGYAKNMEEYKAVTSKEYATMEQYLEKIRERNERELQKPYLTPIINKQQVKSIYIVGINNKNIRIDLGLDFKNWMNIDGVKNPENQVRHAQSYFKPHIEIYVYDESSKFPYRGMRIISRDDAKLLYQALNDKDFIEYVKSLQDIDAEIKVSIFRLSENFKYIWEAFNEKPKQREKTPNEKPKQGEKIPNEKPEQSEKPQA